MEKFQRKDPVRDRNDRTIKSERFADDPVQDFRRNILSEERVCDSAGDLGERKFLDPLEEGLRQGGNPFRHVQPPVFGQPFDDSFPKIRNRRLSVRAVILHVNR